MAIRIAVFIKATFCFIIGIYLAFLGAPTDEAEVKLIVGQAVTEQVASTSQDPNIKEVANNLNSTYNLIGLWLIIIAIAEYVGVVISFVNSF